MDDMERTNVEIKLAKVREGAIIPSYATDGAGWLDVYACFDEYEIIIPAHTCKLVPTGIISSFPKNYRIGLYERGSNTKSGLIVQAGRIDSDYRGEWFVALYNSNDVPVEITKGVTEVEHTEDFIRVPYTKAICQMAVEIVPNVDVIEVDDTEIECDITERGAGCLGSTGK